mgnify:CR=1 FL=1
MSQGMRAKMSPFNLNARLFNTPAYNGINSAAIRIAGIWRTPYLGIRASDIAALRFENINWNSGTLSFTQFKTGDPLTLPLLES